MFMLAEPELTAFAERLMDDLPDHLASCQHLRIVSLPGDSKMINAIESRVSAVKNTRINKALLSQSGPSALSEESENLLGKLILSGSFRERLLAFF